MSKKFYKIIITIVVMFLVIALGFTIKDVIKTRKELNTLTETTNSNKVPKPSVVTNTTVPSEDSYNHNFSVKIENESVLEDYVYPNMDMLDSICNNIKLSIRPYLTEDLDVLIDEDSIKIDSTSLYFNVKEKKSNKILTKNTYDMTTFKMKMELLFK